MKQKFSSRLLKEIRNDIPIENLIEDVLHLPHKKSEGYFRFLCPICSDFHTSTMEKTNLGRCFNCKKNFNPLDLMIIVSELSFTEAVNKLKPLLPYDK